MSNIELIQGDCLEKMKDIPDKSVDMILCDLPYGTTRNKWDSVIDLDALWCQYKRIIKYDGAIVLFAQTPFDKILGASNLPMLKYELIWEKEMGTGFLNANYAPLKSHENILVFSQASASHNGNPMKYNPQMEYGKPYQCRQGSVVHNYDTKNMKDDIVTKNNGTRYPKSVLKFNRDKCKYHPTQKAVALLEYLIKTYSNEGDTILDNTMGSGSTMVACLNTNRNGIGIELNEEYFQIATQRVEEAKKKLTQQQMKLF
jgi:site-specific DNA-methyltransferase (adenine-specific)